jgi:glutamine synthetase
MSICPPGNDFRLGACEAPPSIMSMYLGEQMTRYLEGYRDGVDTPYNPRPSLHSLGVDALPDIIIPAEDRNRTSPFPYGGHRFEFRAVGSSQNVSLVNTVLGTICAKSFKNFAEQIEAGASPRTVAQNALKEHWRIIFNGNGYDQNNQRELIERGLWSINNGVDGMKRYTVDKNIALFEEMKVLTREECVARAVTMFNHYSSVVEIEVKCMIDMISQHIIPGLRTAGVGPVKELEESVNRLQQDFDVIHHTSDPEEKAQLSRVLRLETMIDVRKICTEAERVCPANLWTLATYKELLFVDQCT